MLQRGHEGGGVPRVRAAAERAGAAAAARARVALAPRVPPQPPAAQRAQPAHGAAQRTGLRREGSPRDDGRARHHRVPEDQRGVLHEARRESLRHVNTPYLHSAKAT